MTAWGHRSASYACIKVEMLAMVGSLEWSLRAYAYPKSVCLWIRMMKRDERLVVRREGFDSI